MPVKMPSRGRHRRSPAEIVGVDLGATGLKAVRMRHNKDEISVVAVGILPALKGDDDDTEVRLKLPKNLQANYVALTVSGERAIVRLLNLPGHVHQGELQEAQVREHVGLGDEYRISSLVLPSVRGRSETRVLVVGLHEDVARAALALVPSGPPAPYGIEISGLAALSAFSMAPDFQSSREAVGIIESGAKVTFLALFHKGTLALVRKFDFGAETLIVKVQEQLGVDRETAEGIIADGSFDISQPVHEVMDPFLRQLTISKDFVERREDCRVSTMYLSGGTNLSRYWLNEVKSAAGVEVKTWNPFAGLKLLENSYPDELEGQQARFSAAVGACLGSFAKS